MLNQNEIHKFLLNNNDPAKFSLNDIVEMLAKQLKARITLIDNSGSIIYRKNNPSIIKADAAVKRDLNNNKVYTSRLFNIFPIWINGHSFGAIIVEKKSLSIMEKALLEIASGIISINLR